MSNQLVLDRYRILDQAGTGGFATVYVAWDTRLQRKVAIKEVQISELDAYRATERNNAYNATIPASPIAPAYDPDAGCATNNAYSSTAGYAADPASDYAPTRVLGDDYPESPQPNFEPIPPAATAPISAATETRSPEDIPPWEEDPTCGLDNLVYPTEPDFIQSKPDPDVTNLLPNIPFPEDPAFIQAKAIPQPDRPVSIILGDDDQQRFFSNIPGLDEARAAAVLEDPNIAHVHDFQIMGTQAYIIMEYLDGLSLTDFLSQYDDQLTLDIIASIFSDVAHALEAAHESNVLHLDIKPDNIIVTRKGTVKVTDFGMAALSDREGKAYTHGGTIGYMPPEQMRQESLDSRCDEWALASVTYQMLTGENPFITPTLAQAEKAITSADLKLPSLMWNELDSDADDILFYALDPDRTERYASVSDFAEEFLPFLGEPRHGRKEIAQLLSTGKPVEETAPAPIAFNPKPLWEYFTPKTLRILGRIVGGAGSAALTYFAVENIPQLAAFDPWAPLAAALLAAVIGGVSPFAGALISCLAWGAALTLNLYWIPGGAVIASTLLWGSFTRRSTKSAGNAVLSQPWTSALGIPFLSPLIAGYCLPAASAAVTALQQVVVAFSFAAAGRGDMMGYNLQLMMRVQNSVISPQDMALTLLQQPSTYVVAISWIAAAIVFSLLCSRGNRILSCIGAIVGTSLVITGLCLCSWFTSNGLSYAPSAFATCLAVVCGAALAALCWMAVPRRGEEAPADSPK